MNLHPRLRLTITETHAGFGGVERLPTPLEGSKIPPPPVVGSCGDLWGIVWSFGYEVDVVIVLGILGCSCEVSREEVTVGRVM